MNNSSINQHLEVQHKYTIESFIEYLKNSKHLLFLALYFKNNIYFGNLKIYEISDRVCSFGRLIGPDKYRGLGYGKIMNDLAIFLIFNHF